MKKLAHLLLVLLPLAAAQWVKEYQGLQEKNFASPDGWYIQKQFEATTNIITKCGEVSILGGYKTFGARATLTKMIKIPPHYRLKFNLQFWKIGEWENDAIQVYVDGVLWQMKWGFTEGGKQLCGGPPSKNSDKVFDAEFELPHNSPTPTIVITSSQTQKADVQSWGIREISISYLPCPPECGICHSDKPEQCRFWRLQGLTWFQTDVALEGWQIANGKTKSSECSGVVLFGGFENLGAKATLSRRFTALPPHYQVMVKFALWKIDRWDNDEFFVMVDDKKLFKQSFQLTDGVDLCGADETLPGFGEKIVGIEMQFKHTSQQLDILMSSTLTKDLDEQSWGIRDFFLFIAQCTKFCRACIGPELNECTECDSTHTLKDGKCIQNLSWFIFSKEFFEAKDFEKLNDWQLTDTQAGAPPVPVSKCKDIQLVGGEKICGKNAVAVKKYKKLPLHDHVRLKMTLYKVDFWDGEELSVLLDGKPVWKENLGWNDPNMGNTCGDVNSNWGERIIAVDQIIKHTAEELSLEIKSTLLKPANVGSWGFREVLILYSPLKQCIELFSECDYKGKSAKICDNTEAFKDVNIDFDVRSLRIPEGLKITAYQNKGFKGDRVEFETNQQCLEKIQFSLIQTSQRLPLQGQLRRNK